MFNLIFRVFLVSLAFKNVLGEVTKSTIWCEFKNGSLCAWSNKRLTAQINSVWKVAHGPNANPLMPRRDHNNDSNAWFAYLSHNSSDVQSLGVNNRRAEITVTNNGVTSGGAVRPFCFTLWYYMRADGYVQLNITAVGPDYTLANAFTKESDQGDQWNKLQFTTPGDKNGYVYTISAFASLGVVAIDDIIVEHQPCVKAGAIDSYSKVSGSFSDCDFESTDSKGKPSMCGWYNIGVGKNMFEVISSKKFASSLLPRIDGSGNSSGHYLIVNTRGEWGTEPAVISSPVLGATGPGCKMTFAYRHLYPSNVYPSLNVVLYKRPVSKTLTLIKTINDWNNYTVDLGELSPGYEIHISALNGTTYQNIYPYIDIDLDNIKFIDCTRVILKQEY